MFSFTHHVCLPGFLNVVGGDDNGGVGALNQVQKMLPDPETREQSKRKEVQEGLNNHHGNH